MIDLASAKRFRDGPRHINQKNVINHINILKDKIT